MCSSGLVSSVSITYVFSSFIYVFCYVQVPARFFLCFRCFAKASNILYLIVWYLLRRSIFIRPNLCLRDALEVGTFISAQGSRGAVHLQKTQDLCLPGGRRLNAQVVPNITFQNASWTERSFRNAGFTEDCPITHLTSINWPVETANNGTLFKSIFSSI